MKGLALVVGAGGIGTQIAKDLSESEKDLDVVLCGRKSEFNSFWELDIEDSQSLLQLKNKIANHPAKLNSTSFGINSSIAFANKIGEKAFIEKLSIIFFLSRCCNLFSG